MTRSGRALRVALALCALIPAACGTAGEAANPAGDCTPGEPAVLTAEIVRSLEHDPHAYTQGLVVHDGAIFESTGLVGESSIRELDPATGEVRRTVELDDEVFGEGLAIGADGRLVQLTWKHGTAYERDRDTFEVLRRFDYDGEGWGLTALDGTTLVMSDGSDTLVERDADDFAEHTRRRVRRADGPADLLNELDWDGTSIWANRYKSDEVLRIDPACATVTGVLDLEAIRSDTIAAAGPGDPEPEVANGIAHVPGTDRFLVTGKRWPRLYEIRIVESAGDQP